MSERITEADLQEMERWPDSDDSAIYVEELVAEVRRLRGLIIFAGEVSDAVLAWADSESLPDCVACAHLQSRLPIADQRLEAEARAIRDEQATSPAPRG